MYWIGMDDEEYGEKYAKFWNNLSGAMDEQHSHRDVEDADYQQWCEYHVANWKRIHELL